MDGGRKVGDTNQQSIFNVGHTGAITNNLNNDDGGGLIIQSKWKYYTGSSQFTWSQSDQS